MILMATKNHTKPRLTTSHKPHQVHSYTAAGRSFSIKGRQRSTQNMNQARYWLLTIPENDFDPSTFQNNHVGHLTGQLEIGSESGFRHWQLVASFKKKIRLLGVKSHFGQTAHCEPTRSDAARAYVHKEDTAVPGTRFTHGSLPIRRQSAADWEEVWRHAQAGNLLSIPANIRVQNYRTLRAIRSDFAQPVGVVRTCYFFWGPTGTGKSRRAWQEAGVDAYPKDSSSKFWCGYDGQQNVVIDEFRGNISIGHMLRWLDRYPVNVENKGASLPLSATHFWITSNLSPDNCYPNEDYETRQAFKRRLEIVEFE